MKVAACKYPVGEPRDFATFAARQEALLEARSKGTYRSSTIRRAQGFLDAGEKVIAPHQKLHRFVQDVELLAQGVFQRPGQGDHALFGNFHRRIVAV